jgi:serine/threonine-protein kinase
MSGSSEQRFPVAFGGYLLIEIITRGRRSVVYAARGMEGAAAGAGPLALKRYDPPLLDRDRERLTAAVGLARQSPQAAAILDAGQLGSESYAVMPLVPGPSLERILAAREGVTLPIPVAAAITLAVLEALAELHGRTGHGAVSPRKIVIAGEGSVRLIGLDRAGWAEPDLDWAAPEQLVGARAGPSADLFAAAALLYRLLTGRSHLPSGPDQARKLAAIDPELVSATTLRPEIPPRLDACLRTGLAPDASARFRDAKEMISALSSAAGRRDPRLAPAEVALLLGADPEAIAREAAPRFASESMQEYYRPGETFSGWSLPKIAAGTAIDNTAPSARAAPPEPAPAPLAIEGPAPPVRVRWPVVFWTLSLVIAALCAALVLRHHMKTEVVKVLPAPRPALDPAPRAQPAAPEVVVAAEPEPPPAPAPVPPRLVAPPRPSRPSKAPAKTNDPPRPVAPPVADPAEEGDVRPLIARARALKRSAGPEADPQIDRLLSRLILEHGASSEGRRTRIAALRQELEALERRGAPR